MTSPNLSRRWVVAGAAAALLPMQQALAQAAAGKGDWLSMIKAHHALVAESFDALLGSGGKTHLQRQLLVKTLGYQLTAHSVAEENVIYPAIARLGMVTESDLLYLDQAHAKVMHAQAELSAAAKDPKALMAAAQMLQAAVMKHAKEDEEGRIYPMLRQRLDASQNAVLSTLYQREFSSVQPTRTLL